MEFFRIRKDIPFMRHALVFNVISALTFVAAVFFLIHNNLKFSVEFTGGTEMEVKYAQAADLEKMRSTLEKMGYERPEVTNVDTAHDALLRLPNKPGASSFDTSTKVFAELCKAEQGKVTQFDKVTEKGAQ